MASEQTGKHSMHDEDLGNPSSNKRAKVDHGTESALASLPRTQASTDDEVKAEEQTKTTGRKRWRAHQMVEDYVDTVGNLMFPGLKLGLYSPSQSVERITALGYLTSRARRQTIWEDWSPREVALFEAGLMHYGKHFSKIKDYLPHKTTKDVVAFYYVWKKTSHYQQWKKQYVPEEGAWVMEKNKTGTG